MVYLAIYLIWGPFLIAVNFESQFGTAPGGKAIVSALKKVWTPVASWFARHALGIAKLIGSGGDSQAGYVTVLCWVTISLAAAAIWTIFDRTTARDRQYDRWLRVAVRYALASHMFLYGFDKVVPHAQFPEPLLQRLLTPLGNLNRYAAFWSTMGTSPLYAAFAGGADVVAGILLVFAPSSCSRPQLWPVHCSRPWQWRMWRRLTSGSTFQSRSFRSTCS
jgi:hypothetical protein